MTATENPRLFTKDHELAQTSFAFAPSVFDFAQAFFDFAQEFFDFVQAFFDFTQTNWTEFRWGYKLGTALSGIRPYYAALWRFSIV